MATGTDLGWAMYYEALAEGALLQARRMEDVIAMDRRLITIQPDEPAEKLQDEIEWARTMAENARRCADAYLTWARQLRGED